MNMLSRRMGDLTVKQMEERLGIEFPKEIQEFLENNHQSDGKNIQKGKWHCSDFPFALVCGDEETATKIYNSIKDREKEIKVHWEICIQN